MKSISQFITENSFKKTIQRIAVIFIVFGFWSHVLKAQQNDSLTVKLAPIEITAARTTISSADPPLSLSILSRDLETINSSPSLSLEGIGRQLPGLWVNDRQNYALGDRMMIRGVGWRSAFGVRGIQVVLNGIPLTVADGQTMTNVIEPAFIRRAELIRGPAATYWGNSSGGVLYLSTRPVNEVNHDYLRVRTMAGSFGLRKAEAEYSLSNPHHKMNVYSSYLSTDGFRNYSSSELFRTGIAGTIKLTSKSRMRYQANAIYMPKAQHPSSLTEQQAKQTPTLAAPAFIASGAGKTITQPQAGLLYTLNTSAGLLSISAYGIYRDLENPLPFAIIALNRWAGGIRASLEKSWKSLDLKIGSEIKLQNDDRMEFDNIGNPERGAIQVDQVERVVNEAFFVTGTYHLGLFDMMGGLRYDRIRFTADAARENQSGERNFKSVSPNIGIRYSRNGQTVFANLSTSFEAPTTTELVNRPGNGNGFNPSIDPEQTVGFEMGIRGTNNKGSLRYDLTAYRMWINDLLFPYQLATNGPIYYRNQGQTNHTGIEGHISWKFDRHWNIGLTSTLVEAKFKEGMTLDSLSLSGKNVPGIPRYRFYGIVSYSSGEILGSLSYEYVSSYDVNNLNTAKNDHYSIFDAKISYQGIISGTTMRFQPFLSVKNLLNTRYNGSVVINSSGGRYYEPAPGRSFQIGFSILL
ncbi:MAG: TonB-dependent receptor [Balneolaceae bacterium]|jgi:iron complex outermembrane receptor protein